MGRTLVRPVGEFSCANEKLSLLERQQKVCELLGYCRRWKRDPKLIWDIPMGYNTLPHYRTEANRTATSGGNRLQLGRRP